MEPVREKERDREMWSKNNMKRTHTEKIVECTSAIVHSIDAVLRTGRARFIAQLIYNMSDQPTNYTHTQSQCLMVGYPDTQDYQLVKFSLWKVFQF